MNAVFYAFYQQEMSNVGQFSRKAYKNNEMRTIFKNRKQKKNTLKIIAFF